MCHCARAGVCCSDPRLVTPVVCVAAGAWESILVAYSAAYGTMVVFRLCLFFLLFLLSSLSTGRCCAGSKMAQKTVLLLVLVLGVVLVAWALDDGAFVGLVPNGSLVVKPKEGQEVLIRID